jgi:hypothetical protein
VFYYELMANHSKHTTSSWRANNINIVLRLLGLIVLVVIAKIVYEFFLHHVLNTEVHVFTYFVVGWLVLAYIILPRIYRWISRAFLPNYFIGRTQAGDGILGDPVNLAVIGSEDELVRAMKDAGWIQADPLNLQSSLKMVYSAVVGTSYPSAPVSSLFLFNNKQDLAFEQSVGNNPRRRHHVRFWKTPDGWWLPGGYQADWLGAATFDQNVGLSLFTGQITHKIDADVDKERDFVVSGLREKAEKVERVEHFTTSYNSRNGGGDIIHTDGALPFIRL